MLITTRHTFSVPTPAMRKFLPGLVLVAALLSGSCSGGNDPKVSAQQLADEAFQRYRTEVLTEIRNQSRMIFASMSVTKTAVADDSKLWGKKIGLYSYDTYLRAFIDLSQLTDKDIEWDDEAKTVHVTLPPIRVEMSGRDMTLREDYTNIGLLRSSFDSRDRAKAKEIANRDFRKEFQRDATFRRILEDKARQKATSYFQSFFSKNGYTATIDFRK